jgi:electron transport protein HydN
LALRYPVLDPARCVPCGACEAACVEAHEGRRGLQPDDVIVLERRRLAIRTVAGLPRIDVCTHCTAPEGASTRGSPCVPVCPHAALLRFPGGRVELLEERCTGCGKCVSACPNDAIRRVNDLDLAHKCDGCEGIAGGPACAPACPTEALRIVDVPSPHR